MATEVSKEVQSEPIRTRLDLDDELSEVLGLDYQLSESKSKYRKGEGDADSFEWCHEMTDEEYRQYHEAVKQSRGFDVPYFPNVFEIGLITPIYIYSDCGFFDEVNECAQYALEEHNRATGKKFKIHELVKANAQGCAGTVYYITFMAEDLTNVGESGNSLSSASGPSGGGESDKVGPSGGPLVEFEAKTYIHLPDEQRNCKIDVFYFGRKEPQSQ